MASQEHRSTGLTRRHLLATTAALPLAALLPAYAAAPASARTRPGAPGWPGDAEWAALKQQLGGRLVPGAPPALGADSATLLSNPFWIRDQAGLTQSSGFIDGWRSAPSAWAVRASSAADVAAAVSFAAAHNLRVAVKGGGHSYFGGSSAPDSLLIWTRDLEEITVHDGFTPHGSSMAPVPAVSVGAGCVWGDVYRAVIIEHGRYVQGGGCTTVGVAGLVQGGGFGSHSKMFGNAAASLLEAEIVTADGTVRIVNDAQEPDLFWALKGGGGGTWGVVTRMTLKTHDLPATFGIVRWSLEATSGEAFHRLLTRFVTFYAEKLFNPHWGEQVGAGHGNRFELTMLFNGLDGDAAKATWQEFADFVAASPADYRTDGPPLIAALPAASQFDGEFYEKNVPDVVRMNDLPNAKKGQYWWAANTNEAGTFWHGYQSAWLPASLLQPDRRADLAQAWFDASRLWSVTFHCNKGLAGGPPEALAASRETAMNPEVLDAFALVIIADDGKTAYLGLTDVELAEARDDAAHIQQAMAAMSRVAPGAGSYLSECDFGLKDWQRACWGPHWKRLSAIKHRYDPDGLFIVHHGVGSEGWSPDGFTRL